jgi:hypothetical protein
VSSDGGSSDLVSVDEPTFLGDRSSTFDIAAVKGSASSSKLKLSFSLRFLFPFAPLLSLAIFLLSNADVPLAKENKCVNIYHIWNNNNNTYEYWLMSYH